MLSAEYIVELKAQLGRLTPVTDPQAGDYDI